MRATLVAAALVAIGFVLFVNAVADMPDDVPTADGIVALTGGEARIAEAIKLLSQKKGKRLLITGVNPSTTREELQRLIDDGGELFNCCVDLDHNARDTVGNAEETHEWVEEQGFGSLIVVTSSYHMPRALAELGRESPGVRLFAYPVTPANLHIDSWWAHPGTFRLLASEYVKYLPAVARLWTARLFDREHRAARRN
ncbi:MAG: YdcF family protein [Pseudomonadota bacterium]|nr:YdcF family protein [Pseudomonadota bacterium]